MHLTKLAGLSAAILIWGAVPAGAIIMRHDVEDWRYVQLGYEHSGVLAQLGLPAESDGAPMLYSGMGTLIAPDWIVTAAHAGEYLQQNPPPNGASRYVYVKGRGYAVAEIILHPAYNAETYANDIALIHLTGPVRAAAPACLNETEDEVGKIVTLVGAGYQGNGRDGPAADPDGVLRGSTVRVGSAEDTVLTWRFHAPSEAGVTPLEGISGPGDSGGPALIETPRGFCIAGVSSAQRIEIQEGQERAAGDHPVGEGRYGVTEVYTRVSRYVPWIVATMAAR